MSDVFVDSKFVGNITNAKDFVDKFLSERRIGKLPIGANIYYDETLEEVHVETSKGRAIRPLIIVNDGKSLLTKRHLDQLQKGELVFTDLVKQGIIEYLDSAEEENTYVAFNESDLTEEHTHLEINPVDIIGLVANLVPFGHNIQGVRFLQGAKNQKQGIGFYSANYLNRMDMDVNILHTPQVPITTTLMYDVSEYHKHPSGQNFTIAVMSYDGYNMEDAIILSKGSIDRGLGRSTYYRPVIAEELRYSGGLVDQICVPDKEVKGYKSEHEYRLLEDDGVIFTESKVSEEDVIVGRTSPPRFLSGADEYNLTTNMTRESSVAMKYGEKGTIDFVVLTENTEGNKLVQVRIRDQRIPEIGDKFTSRHGQKGVVGLIVPAEDMPFSESGISPDILFNPQGIPTRMTISHLLEILGGKVGGLNGRQINATTFNSEKEADMRKELKNLGFRDNGTETMYDGRTGKRFQARIFVGSIYYLKLKHQVANKIQSRARGPIQLLTRQPTEGRAKEGGLRLGEMEKDTFVAHGAALLLKERFNSDSTLVPVCEKCGSIAVYDVRKERAYCPYCGESSKVSNVEISYAFKLLLDEVRSMMINPMLKLKTKY
jgi:DNA-directed RNA polymerase subunit B